MHLQMNSTLSFSYIFSVEKDGCSSAQTSFILNGLVLPTFIFIFVESTIKQLKYSSTILGVRTQLKCVQSLNPFHSQNKGDAFTGTFAILLKAILVKHIFFTLTDLTALHKISHFFQNQ